MSGGSLFAECYVRLLVPTLSMSVINSLTRQEIMQVSVNDIDYRHAHQVIGDVPLYTQAALNIDSVQVENPLPTAIVPIILAPTRVKHMQPVVRASAKLNRRTSHQHVESFDAVELVVQELDLKLEQQTVLDTW